MEEGRDVRDLGGAAPLNCSPIYMGAALLGQKKFKEAEAASLAAY
jgi:hypothetical protein